MCLSARFAGANRRGKALANAAEKQYHSVLKKGDPVMENNDISRVINDALSKLRELGGTAKLYGLIKAEEAKE